MAPDRSEILQATLDLMVLKTLHAVGPPHGYGIARRIAFDTHAALLAEDCERSGLSPEDLRCQYQ